MMEFTFRRPIIRRSRYAIRLSNNREMSKLLRDAATAIGKHIFIVNKCHIASFRLLEYVRCINFSIDRRQYTEFHVFLCQYILTRTSIALTKRTECNYKLRRYM